MATARNFEVIFYKLYIDTMCIWVVTSSQKQTVVVVVVVVVVHASTRNFLMRSGTMCLIALAVFCVGVFNPTQPSGYHMYRLV